MEKLVFLISLFSFQIIFSQDDLNELLKKYNKNSVPYITPKELYEAKNDYIILDTREFEEFKVSAIKDGIFVGYEKFNLKRTIDNILDNKKNTKILVYCSLGIRSEDIGEQLIKAGFINVFNLYGGIFEWKNKRYPIINIHNKSTEKVHAFDKKWGKWLKKGVKIYE